MAKVHDDVTMAEVQVLQSLGDALGQKQMQVLKMKMNCLGN